jgi:uncharacterized protein (DUF58 family)
MPDVNLDLFKKIQRIQIQTSQLSKNVLAGAYRSAFRGNGLEFEEVREFREGDDTRTIDWNVTARMNGPFVKTFREERELTVMLLVDVSFSSQFGSKEHLKSELIAEIGATLAFSAIKNNDKVGLILFSEDVEKYIPPNKGSRHVLRLIRELLVFQPKKFKTNLGVALSFLEKVQRKASVCFVISDFLSPEFEKEMALTAKSHDLINISVTDPYEVEFPSLGLITLQDLETEKRILIDSSNRVAQRDFKKNSAERKDKQKQFLKKIGASFIDIQTNLPYMPPLRRFFTLRGKRRK